ncbi:hypothetical protein [Methylobacterium fujisawaense]|uniref:hypothetical protein n=1 Tax=Methylobacterium fujisawaense TaxID=107400 RepID=UPI00313F2747
MTYQTVLALGLSCAAFGLEARVGAPSETDRAALRQRCGGDYATYCGDLPPDGPEVQACFRKNMADLSPACRAEIGRHEKAGRKG